MSKIEINVNNQFSAQKEIKDLVDDVERVLNREIQVAAGEIVKRTQQGQTPDGGNFKSYTKGYAKYKAKKGRNTNVDLTFSGQMLQAIQTKIEKTASAITAIIFFNVPRSNRGASGKGSTITNPALAEILGRVRPFFALSDKQIDKIINALQKK